MRVLLITVLVLSCANLAGADESVPSCSTRPTVSLDLLEDPASNALSLTELKSLEAAVRGSLQRAHEAMEKIFRRKLCRPIVLRLVSSRQFARLNGGKRDWNAVYLRGQIAVRIKLPGSKKRRPISIRSIARTIRHEVTHAAVSELSSGRVPAWIEEGLAQLFEGPVNKRLPAALAAQLEHRALQFTELEQGFGALPQQFEEAAYAQSLFAVRTLSNTAGMSGFIRYFDALRSGQNPKKAFEAGFGMSPERFEEMLIVQLERWRKSGAAVI